MIQTVFTMPIKFNEQDFVYKNINPYVVFNMFTEIATQHAEVLGVGFNDMIQKHMLWVTMRVKYQVLGDILPNKPYVLKTFPQAKNMLEFDRDFLLLDSSGNIVLKGTSKWCVIDSQTRRILKMINLDLPCADIEPAFNQKFLKTPLFEPQTAPDLSYKVLTSDIDANGHMNNAVYAKIVFNTLRLPKDKKIDTFQLNFLREAMCGDRIDVYLKNEQNGINVLGKRCEADNSFSAYILFKE